MSVTAVPPLALSALLRDGSREEHRDAEGSSFMSELVAGRVSGRGYAHYLTCLREVYAALEEVAHDLQDDPLASAVIDHDLDRLAAIDADLVAWGGPVAVSSPAAEAYASRIRDAAAWGGLFVAHHYTRYLGDLSGGQVIGRVLTREYDLPEGAGVDFYRFDAIPKPKPYKDRYRATLDSLPLDDAGRGRILDEVKAVFGLNGAIFAELSELLPEYRR